MSQSDMTEQLHNNNNILPHGKKNIYSYIYIWEKELTIMIKRNLMGSLEGERSLFLEKLDIIKELTVMEIL